MKILKLAFALSLLLIVVNACKKEEVPEPPPVINIDLSDLTTTVEENLTEGSVIGTIASNESDVVFEVVNSDPAGSIVIGPLSGEITVASSTAFDAEKRNVITASIRATKGTASAFANVTINITDEDDLKTLLSTSRAAYEAETTGWIKITKSEYDLIAERLAEATKFGTTDEDYDAPGTILQTSENQTHSNSIYIQMPANHYFVMFKYHNKSVNVSGVRPKISNNFPTSGYVGRGPLPAHESGDQYFLRKGSQVLENTNTYLGIYTPGRVGWKENSNCERYFRFGNGSDLSNGQNGAQVLIQGVATSLKQWD